MAIRVDIEGYDSLEQIGVGGMAAVYRARKTSIDKVVAIKVLFPYLASDASFIERFQREARAAARIQHENIVNVIDYGESGGAYYIVMEYYDGMTLEQIMREHPVLPLDVAILVLLEVCYGLEAAHAADVVHRDIKPGNIIYTRQGAIKIADFGLARRGDSATMITQEGKVIGTPAYMSPEQAAGRPVGPQSDIFSLGVVAYEMLCRRRPFEGRSYSEVLERIQTCDPPPMTDVNPLVQPDFERIVRRMLQRDPADRYASVSEVIADIEQGMERLDLARDRRRLQRYIEDPERYEKHFREKTITRCLSQGAWYMRQGQAHIDDAILAFRRILYLDPDNERARRNLERLLERTGGADATRAVDAVPVAGGATSASARTARGDNAKAARARGTASRRRRGRTRRGSLVRRVATALGLVALALGAAAAGVVRGWIPADVVPDGVMPAGLVGDGNRPPALSAPDRLEVDAGDAVEFELAAVDPEGDAVTFEAVDLPPGATLSRTGRFAWRVPRDAAGEVRARFRARDGHGAAERTTRIRVRPAPVEFAPVADGRVRAGSRLRRRLHATSPSGAPVRFELAEAPRGARIEGDALVWDVPRDARGVVRIGVVATDGRTRAERSVSVRVLAPRGRSASTGARNERRESSSAGARGRDATSRESQDAAPGATNAGAAEGAPAGAADSPEARFGTLSVYFLGGVGTVELDGRALPDPPLTGYRVKAGRHRLRCRLPRDAKPRTLEVIVEPGRETVVEYELGGRPRASIGGGP